VLKAKLKEKKRIQALSMSDEDYIASLDASALMHK